VHKFRVSLVCSGSVGNEWGVDGEDCFRDCQSSYQSTRIRSRY